MIFRTAFFLREVEGQSKENSFEISSGERFRRALVSGSFRSREIEFSEIEE